MPTETTYSAHKSDSGLYRPVVEIKNHGAFTMDAWFDTWEDAVKAAQKAMDVLTEDALFAPGSTKVREAFVSDGKLFLRYNVNVDVEKSYNIPQKQLEKAMYPKGTVLKEERPV